MQQRPFGMSDQEVFDFFVEKRGENDCWLSTRGKNNSGYSYVRLGDVSEGIHRLAWKLYRGQIPKGISVLHTCDVRACANPRHLWLGTHKDNVQDMMQKKRGMLGENHVFARVTEDQVVKMRQEYADGGITSRQLAARYSLCRAAVEKILHGQNWKSAGGPIQTENLIQRGERSARARLTAEKVRAIRQRFLAGEDAEMLAQEFGISYGYVFNLAYRRTWGHVD